MIAAVNSKRARYDPLRYMMNGRGLKEQQRAKAAERAPMTGEAIVMRLKQIGFPIIDNRKRPTTGHGDGIG